MKTLWKRYGAWYDRQRPADLLILAIQLLTLGSLWLIYLKTH